MNWLRVVLDEGHVIRNPNALQSKAILELQSERRWILSGTFTEKLTRLVTVLDYFFDVLPLNTTKRTDYYLNAHEVHLNFLPSGTPIQNSLKDLYMLMSFLKLKPFNVKEWWNRIIQRPVTMGDKVGLKYVNNSFIPNHILSINWIFLPYTVNVFSGTCKRW